MQKSDIPQWDLSDLYKSISDPKIDWDKKEIYSKIKLLSKNFTKSSLKENLKLYEKIMEKLSILDNFAHLIYTTNFKDEKISKHYQATSEYISETKTKLLWFEIYLIKNKSNVKGYEKYLESLRKLKPYTLSEDKEIILSKKSQTGIDSFIRFYDEIDSSKNFEGKTYSQIASIYSNDPERNKRKIAGEKIQNDLKDNSNLYKFILNTLLLDKKIDDDIRGFKYPQESTFISYDVDKEIVNTMSKVIAKNYKISERYYKAKSKILGQKLYEWDRYSDIYPKLKNNISWSNAKEIVLNSFRSFSETFGNEASKFFENGWIDANAKIGKQSGAYCAYVSNSIHPYIFMNFNGESTDVRTLAHELGHGVHGVLSKNNNYLDFRPSTATAEIASVFSESLVFDELYKNAKTKTEKVNLLGGKLQSSFATVFRQNAFYLFESELHKKRREEGELSSETINNLYQKYLQQMFGKGLALSKNHKYMWMVISHFYHYNFYVFTYSFGELLATSLYAIYKRDGKGFVEKYIKALSLGASKSPIEITKAMGVDITKEEFWQSGLNLINNQVKEFEKLVI